jgi:hypothetical protein
MKPIVSNASFIEFYFFEIVYTQFHLDEISLNKLFFMLSRKLCGSLFNENEIPIMSNLRANIIR